MTLLELSKIINGQLIGTNDEYVSLSTDTRTLGEKQVFVAIKGENFDGHDFLTIAKERGATAAIVSQDVPAAMNLIRVADTRLALGAYAAHQRNQYAIPLIAITGSCGKTTTKSMVESILKQCGNVLANKGTFNNDIGVPLTLMQMNASHQFAVVEMGMNHFGEIRYITNLAKPTVALITNAAAAHLEGVNTLEGVAQAKSEIFEGLSENGTAIINADDNFADYWKGLLAGKKIITFGSKNTADFHATDIRLEDGKPIFKLHSPLGSIEIHLPILGQHNVINALAAAAAAYTAGASLTAIKQGLESLAPVTKRLVEYAGKHGAHIIDDSYNANPLSLRAAVDILSTAKGKKILVVADMKELGQDTEKYHAELGAYAKEKGLDALYAYGKNSLKTVAAFGSNGHHFHDQEQLIEAVQKVLNKDTTVLVKGSRSMRMENVVSSLIK